VTFLFEKPSKKIDAGFAIYTSNETITIPPPPSTYHLSVPYSSFIVGKIQNVHAIVKNPSYVVFEGFLSLKVSSGQDDDNTNNKLFKEMHGELVEVKSNSAKRLVIPVTANVTGDLVVTFGSSVYNRAGAKKKVKVTSD